MTRRLLIALTVAAATVLSLGFLAVTSQPVKGQTSCEVSIELVRAQVAVQGTGVVITEYTGEKVKLVRNAWVSVYGPAPWDMDEIELIAYITFPGFPLTNVGFFDKDGCLVGSLKGVTPEVISRVMEAAFGRRA